MRNPSRTLQNSIFEPLFARAEEELHFQPPTKTLQSDWLIPQGQISPSPPASSALLHPDQRRCTSTMKRAAATIFNHHLTDERLHDFHNSITDRDQHTDRLGMHFSPDFNGSSTMPSSSQSCPWSRCRSSGDVVEFADDGSIASKLLGSITKSISSPSLPSCCKESARETPYQKSLRLREMKLQHCAEELGSESSDGGRSLSDGGYGSIISGRHSMMGDFERSTQPPTEIMDAMDAAHPNSEGDGAIPALISVRSSPNLRRTSSFLSKTKEKSFPPPLTHTLPRSNSSDSFTYSLRACREGGHFLLKEVKVPCRQYLEHSRKDGRLTLRLFTTYEDSERQCSEEDDMNCKNYFTDEDSERQYSEEDEKDCKGLQTDYNMEVCVHQAASDDDDPGNATLSDDGSSEKIEVRSTIRASCVEESRVCRVEESKLIDVGMVGTGENGAVAARSRHGSAVISLHTACTSGNDNSARTKKAKIINVIADNGALSKVEFVATNYLHKTCAISFLSLPYQHRLIRQQTLINYPPDSFPKLQMGQKASSATGSSSSRASFSLELRGGASNGVAKMIFLQGTEVQPAGWSSTRQPGYSPTKRKTASMIIFKDVNAAKRLMEKMSKLVATVGNMDEGKWCSYGGEDQKRSRERDNSVNTDRIKDSSIRHWSRSINTGLRSDMEHNHHKAKKMINRLPRRISAGAVIRESSDDQTDGTCGAESSCSRRPISPCHANLQEAVPSSIHNEAVLLLQGKLLQAKEWQQALHSCKEILCRNQLPEGLMKLHCVA